MATYHISRSQSNDASLVMEAATDTDADVESEDEVRPSVEYVAPEDTFFAPNGDDSHDSNSQEEEHEQGELQMATSDRRPVMSGDKAEEDSKMQLLLPTCQEFPLQEVMQHLTEHGSDLKYLCQAAEDVHRHTDCPCPRSPHSVPQILLDPYKIIEGLGFAWTGDRGYLFDLEVPDAEITKMLFVACVFEMREDIADITRAILLYGGGPILTTLSLPPGLALDLEDARQTLVAPTASQLHDDIEYLTEQSDLPKEERDCSGCMDAIAEMLRLELRFNRLELEQLREPYEGVSFRALESVLMGVMVRVEEWQRRDGVMHSSCHFPEGLFKKLEQCWEERASFSLA